MRWYKMGKNQVIPAKSVEDWGSFREEHRRVAEDTINGLWVSTVFLGLDHNFFDDGPPIVFETMVFPNENDLGDLYQERYATWNEAVAGHERVCDMVRSGEIA